MAATEQACHCVYRGRNQHQVKEKSEEGRDLYDAEENTSKGARTGYALLLLHKFQQRFMVLVPIPPPSHSSGIADYRSSINTVLDTGPGVWELMAHGQAPPKGRRSVPLLKALPSPTHMAIVKLHEARLAKFTVSQNVDGLHRRSGIPPTELAELHGNTNLETCMTCGRQYLRDFDTRCGELIYRIIECAIPSYLMPHITILYMYYYRYS